MLHNIVCGGGGGGGGLKGQAKGEKRDHSDEIGCQKGKCINNFGVDCLKYSSLNGFKRKLHQESFMLPVNLRYGHFRFTLVHNRQ